MQSTMLLKSICLETEKICRNFIWVDNEHDKRPHLVQWKKCCQPRMEEGLGLRNIHCLNRAFMMKLGWGILNDNTTLWAEVIRVKYVHNQTISS